MLWSSNEGPVKWLISLLFHAGFKWRLQENRFFLVFGLIIHFMATTTKAKRCIFISRTPKYLGYRSILNKSRRYRLFSALLRSQFNPIWIPFSWLSVKAVSRHLAFFLFVWFFLVILQTRCYEQHATNILLLENDKYLCFYASKCH